MLQRNYPKMSWWLSSLLALMSGVLIMLSVPTWDLFFLGWMGLVPLAAVLAAPGRTLKGAFLYGWLAGIAAHMGGFYWLLGTMVRFGNLHPALAAAIFLIFGLASAAAYGLIALGTKLMMDRRLPLPLSLAVSLVTVEAFFPHLFPWLLAMSHWRLPLSFQTAEIWGAAGISGILAVSSGVIFEKIACDAGWLVRTRTMRTLARITAALVCFMVVYGALRMEMVGRQSRSLPGMKVGIVQPNISIEEKGDPSYGMRILWLLQSFSLNLEQRGAGLIVWPETSYPFKIPRGQKKDFDGGRKISTYTTVPIVTGAVSYGGGRFYNSAFLVAPDQTLVGPSDKNNLVLFGEYNPLYDILPESLRIRYPGIARRGLTAGKKPVLLEHREMRLGVLNCLEDILPGYTAKVVRAGANLLVNITNDAWFGDTPEPWQHLALAVFRTVENRRELVRSVNTGVSAAVDLTGKIKYMSGTFQQEYVTVDVKLSTLKTPFQAAGDWLRWLCGGIIIMVFILGILRGSMRKYG
jgi:apolipoprotein N-acyltransferase